MRKPNRFSSLEKVCRKGAAFMVSMFMIQALCFLLPWEARAEGGEEDGQKQAHADYVRLARTWVRPDGGYVIEIKDVRSNGRLKAG
jgi:hypothetical protein